MTLAVLRRAFLAPSTSRTVVAPLIHARFNSSDSNPPINYPPPSSISPEEARLSNAPDAPVSIDANIPVHPTPGTDLSNSTTTHPVTSPSPTTSAFASLASLLNERGDSPSNMSLGELAQYTSPALSGEDEHHLHIYSHKHNTHLTFTCPKRNPLISWSAGNLGFRKAQRGTYDAAYQLTAKMLKTIEDRGIRPKAVEVILRGFGKGREAAVKVLLGSEGRYLKPIIRRVTDSTRLKFGGTRNPSRRRLG
ncbi:translational machinery component [Ascodesmis nigricans]|uniref:Translational machinery component n=1 Tax=Ascodesmis nigricans TaxID=341454 RepID=A0A4S2N2J9_9PEZI|nr:translational machinery component [Ascodesmis nigricans]